MLAPVKVRVLVTNLSRTRFKIAFLDTSSLTAVDASSTHGKVSDPPTDKEKEKQRKKRKRSSQEEDIPELQQDAELDPSPFHFKPHALAHLLDPKSLDDLERMGGIEAVTVGLGTDKDRGLSEKQLAAATASEATASNSEPEALPAITLTEPSGTAQPTAARQLDHEAPYKASLQDRIRVYGQNVLPERKSKTLLQLMWLAMKDKVLVCLDFSSDKNVASSCLDFTVGGGGRIPRVGLFSGLRYTTGTRRATS